jgi:hypothetical protein
MPQDDLRARLLAAATSGEIVSIVYHRGSQPGTVREIVPLAVSDDEVRARDIAAGIDKSFKLAQLELATPGGTTRRYDPAVASLDESLSIGSTLASHVPALQAMGWHVEVTDTCVSVHGFFKNGKPRKGADVMLMFNEWSVEPLDDGVWQEPGVKSSRPFYLSSPSFERARTFARLSVAVPMFLEEARKLAPKENGRPGQ